jgi:dienelactone hydrolase
MKKLTLASLIICIGALSSCQTTKTDKPAKDAAMTNTTSTFGSWNSPISAAAVATAGVGISDLRAHAGSLFWRESRPMEKGRQVLMQRTPSGELLSWTAPEFSVRTRVHEYGGNSYVVFDGGVVFANFSDQRLYWQATAGGLAVAITPAGFQYADGNLDRQHGRMLWVREDHREATKKQNGEERNEIVAIPLPGKSDATSASGFEENAGEVLQSGADFYAYPRSNPAGDRLVWVEWNHPQMPWDTTRLMSAALLNDRAHSASAIVDTARRAPLEPTFNAKGELYFIDDARGWWNLARLQNGGAQAVVDTEQEFAGPLWQLGVSSYVLIDATTAIARTTKVARDYLVRIDLEKGTLTELATPFVSISELQILDGNAIAFIAQDETDNVKLVSYQLASGKITTLHQPSPSSIDARYIAKPSAIEFPTSPAADGKARTAHAWFYPPTNGDYASNASLPPLIVTIHGGPTGVSKPVLSLGRQYFTSRGFALVDVNYGGSTSFGRDYRERLNGQWGVVDVADAIAAVDYLVAQGKVDPQKVAIRGGSAGGFTTLAALAFHDRFKAGANLYGVSDIKSLAATSHKFERNYDVSLVGPPNDELYKARSPIHHLDGFKEPLITLQGSEDKVVPPAQSQAIVAALDARKVPHAYIEFAGEQHGFRKSENMIRALEAELYFYGQIFGFTPADPIEPVEIKHWRKS